MADEVEAAQADAVRAQSFLPLKPVDFLVLLALDRHDLHGYGLVQEIAEQSDGKIRLVPGNLYTVLRRLLDRGLIAESSRRPVPGQEDVRRRYYSLSALGGEVLGAEARRLQELVAVIEKRQLAGPGELS